MQSIASVCKWTKPTNMNPTTKTTTRKSKSNDASGEGEDDSLASFMSEVDKLP
jgi:hypothetical protein